MSVAQDEMRDFAFQSLSKFCLHILFYCSSKSPGREQWCPLHHRKSSPCNEHEFSQTWCLCIVPSGSKRRSSLSGSIAAIHKRKYTTNLFDLKSEFLGWRYDSLSAHTKDLQCVANRACWADQKETLNALKRSKPQQKKLSISESRNGLVTEKKFLAGPVKTLRGHQVCENLKWFLIYLG